MDFLNGVEDERFDRLREEDALCLTNNHRSIPELAWRYVLNKLKNKMDINNCSNSSLFFCNLLQKQREREVVLPNVFGILARRYCDEQNNDDSYKEANVESIPWQIGIRWWSTGESEIEPHRMTGIWKCRLVCKKWNAAIEEIHRNENAGHYRMRPFLSNAKNGALGKNWGTDCFSDELQVDKFIGCFHETHFDGMRRVSKKCPFLGRAVTIEYDYNNYDWETEQAYVNKVMELLEKFGDQVWYFKLCDRYYYNNCGAPVDQVYIYHIVTQMVKLMPNLKVLRITHKGWVSKERLLALEEEIEKFPFPERPNLEMISIKGIHGVWANHLINQNQQISRMRIDQISDFHVNCAIFSEKLSKFNQLSLMQMMSPLEMLEAFESSTFTLSLTKLYFDCNHLYDSSPFVRLARIFNALNSTVNSDTCTDLTLEMPFTYSEAESMSVLQDSLKCRLQLASIQHVHIRSTVRFSLDFLLPSKNSLREIGVSNWSDLSPEWSGEEEIKFMGIEDKMEYSNIAKQLPALKLLTIYPREYDFIRHYSIKPNGVVLVENVKRYKFDNMETTICLHIIA